MEWDELILKYPHNMDIQMLHAVRIGLCKKIDAGPVDFNMAKYAFNRLHEVVVKRANQAKRLGIKMPKARNNSIWALFIRFYKSCLTNSTEP